MENGSKLTFKQQLTIALSSVTLFVALWNFETVLSIAGSVFSYVTPLLVGACMAFIINIPIRGFEKFFAWIQRKLHLKPRHGLNTILGLLFSVAALAGIVVVFINYVVPDITESIESISATAKENYPKAKDFLAKYGIELQGVENFIKDFSVDKVLDLVSGYIKINSKEMVNTVISAAGTTVSIVITVFSCIVFSVYMISGKKKLNIQARKLIYAYTPKKFADKACYIGSLFHKTFTSFISSQCLDALLLALILYMAMTLFRLPYTGIICVLTGILALIPYVGALSSCVLGAALILLTSPLKALIFLGVFMVVQQLEGQFIYPHLVGGSVGLPAIWTLFAALVGGEMMGLFGIIFFIPLAAVIYTLVKEGVGNRLHKKGIVVESPLELEEREKRRIQTEKRDKRRKERFKRKVEKRRKRAYYYDNEDDDDEE
ncbi:MAG: AI-2E family transporter [Clostridia bacterium]|nr:AI-2E family transporter [Clostridia bacterium]